MRISNKVFLTVLGLSQLTHHVLSRALPPTEAEPCVGNACPDDSDIEHSQPLTWRNPAGPTADLETWKIARALIEPVPVAPKIIPEPAAPPKVVPNPVDPLNPEKPNEATAFTGPNNVKTFFTKVSTVPDGPSATIAASHEPTEDPTPSVVPSRTAPSVTNLPLATVGPNRPQPSTGSTDPAATKDEDSSGLNDEPDVPQEEASSYLDLSKPNPARNGLQAAIRQKQPDKEALPFGENYAQTFPFGTTPQTAADLRASDSTGISPVLSDSFADTDINIPSKTRFTRTQIASESNSDPAPVCDAAFSTDGKVLIAINSQKGNDFVDDDKQLPWSEFIFQQAQRLNGGMVSNLQWFVRNKVSNPNTLSTTEEAYQKLNLPRTEKLVLGVSDTDSVRKDAFDAMSRTVNVKGVNWLLADHHNAFGNKQIKTIVIVPNGDKPEALGGLDGVDIFLELA